MTAKNEASVEPQQKILADSFDREEAPAVESLGNPTGRCPRVRRLDVDAFAHKLLQAPSGAMQRVALRHACGYRRQTTLTRFVMV
jgi:hypothetical protein